MCFHCFPIATVPHGTRSLLGTNTGNSRGDAVLRCSRGGAFGRGTWGPAATGLVITRCSILCIYFLSHAWDIGIITPVLQRKKLSDEDIHLPEAPQLDGQLPEKPCLPLPHRAVVSPPPNESELKRLPPSSLEFPLACFIRILMCQATMS